MTDRPGENRPAPFFGLGADLKALAGAIGWLAGTMSGVVALMYAVGFLCAKSHLYMLGIETHSGVPAGAYVEIGAKFFYIFLIYGALVMPNDFPRVYVHAGKDSQVRIPEGSFHLIHQGEKYLILWHADKAASYVIPCSGVTTLEVLGRASVFAGQPPT
jgi:hypothetical protein